MKILSAPSFDWAFLVIPAKIAGMAVLTAADASFSFIPSCPATLRTIDCPIELFNNSDRSIFVILFNDTMNLKCIHFIDIHGVFLIKK